MLSSGSGMASSSVIGEAGAAAWWACTTPTSPPGLVSPARAPPTPFDDALGTGRRAFISSGSGSLVMPRWLKSGPRMKPSTETVWDLRPKRPTKP